MRIKSSKNNHQPSIYKKQKNLPLFSNPQLNYQHIKKHLNYSEDLIIKTINIPDSQQLTILYLETMIDQNILQEKLFNPLLLMKEHMNSQQIQQKIQLDHTPIVTIQDAVQNLLQGSAIVFFLKNSTCLSFEVKSTPIRSIMEPTTEKVIRGSHDGFIESLNANVNIMRNRIINPNLTVSYFDVGKEAKSKVAMLYLKGGVDSQVVRTITTKLNALSNSNRAPSDSIEKVLESSSFSPFPQTLNTERPDRVMKYLLQGHIALFEDHNPNALIMPITFFSFYQSPEDDNARTLEGLFFHFIRFISIWIALILLALYIAIIGFHFELLPNDLILTIKSSIQGIPYPPLSEALLMEFILEFIREAAVRLPTPISQTIGVVGGLVIGDAVVKSGLVSNVMIVVIALTAIASFIVPSTEMSNSIRIVRFFFMFAASFIGLPGITFAFMILIIHMCSLRSMGKPYLTPFALFDFKKGCHTFHLKLFRNKKKQTCRTKRKETR